MHHRVRLLRLASRNRHAGLNQNVRSPAGARSLSHNVAALRLAVRAAAISAAMTCSTHTSRNSILVRNRDQPIAVVRRISPGHFRVKAEAKGLVATGSGTIAAGTAGDLREG